MDGFERRIDGCGNTFPCRCRRLSALFGCSALCRVYRRREEVASIDQLYRLYAHYSVIEHIHFQLQYRHSYITSQTRTHRILRLVEGRLDWRWRPSLLPEMMPPRKRQATRLDATTVDFIAHYCSWKSAGIRRWSG